MQVQPFYDFNICQHEKFIGIAPYGHALAMAGHSMIFLPEQKYSKRTKR
jgi:hypothetical protein